MIDARLERLAPIRARNRRGEARRQAFLAAAEEVMLEQGYEAASVNEIVRRAGGSLATLYQQFHNKEGLFLAMIEHVTARAIDPVSEPLLDDYSLEAGLETIGRRYLAVALQPRGIAVFRTLVSESVKFPGLLQRFLDMGFGRARQALAAFLAVKVEAGEANVPDCDFAAGAFLDMVRGQWRLRLLSDPQGAPDEATCAAHVRACVALFLNEARAS